MDAAEELFSKYGVEGVSIRSVNAAAGLAPVAVHYHFRTKDRLLEAVVLRRGKAVAARAAALLDAFEAQGTPPTAQDVIKALAIPYRELLDSDPVGGLRWLRLIARLVLAEDRRLRRLNAGPRGLEARFARFVHWAFPDASEQPLEMAWRISFSVLMLMLGISDARIIHQDGSSGRISEQYVNTLVDLVATGFAGVVAAQRRPSGTGRLPGAGVRRGRSPRRAARAR